jgi:protein disulfide-isomerase A1
MISAFAAQLASGEVVNLTPDNFDDITGQGKVLVKFFAPWCGHCKTMAPHYIKDSDNVDEGIKLAEVDCDVAANKESICSKHGIQGFPTLKWFDADGSVSEYDGGRGEGAFAQWTSDIIKPVVQTVTEVPKVAAGERIQLTLQATELSADFEKVAKANRKHAIFNFLEVDGDAKVSVHRHNEDDVEVTDASVEALTKAVNDYRFPLFGELNGETFGDYSEREGRDLLWTLLKFEKSEDMKENVDKVREDMGALAKNFDKYSFTFTDTVQFAQPIEGMLGVKTEDLPAVVVQSGKKKFVLKGEVNKADVEKFLNGIADGSVTADVKSEPVPETNDGPVRQVVATTMQEELFQEDKDVLLKAYAPWCGHCKNMAEDYKALGAELPKDKIVIAEIDGSANDSTIEGIEWSGFPTLFWIPKGSKEAKPYDGPRDKAGMLEWIKKNSEQDLSIDVEAMLEKEAEPTEEL